ncbi:MAG: hypothetical protein IPK26_09790 [Planctomycetes bacterium]|nr:hypothetical protein [Planctomycetota bacterium]
MESTGAKAEVSHDADALFRGVREGDRERLRDTMPRGEADSDGPRPADGKQQALRAFEKGLAGMRQRVIEQAATAEVAQEPQSHEEYAKFLATLFLEAKYSAAVILARKGDMQVVVDVNTLRETVDLTYMGVEVQGQLHSVAIRRDDFPTAFAIKDDLGAVQTAARQQAAAAFNALSLEQRRERVSAADAASQRLTELNRRLVVARTDSANTDLLEDLFRQVREATAQQLPPFIVLDRSSMTMVAQRSHGHF